ncbi:probable serine/threonine protein kinase IREH1 [Lycium ferocissimum]|uniref:probable serine/threonine protein kinase IREH1 n=1 Tax=Lycium ferocissimum TaxID=112874 RepID=UPI002814E48F|nr:probable serine/threonine protein kinase IREH1 [Lycium ferocissimum]
MVFKGRFFSSKKSDSSSPNSPRSSGSNSPIRSDNKKKGKSTSKDNSPSTPTPLSSFTSFRDKKKDGKGKESTSSSTPSKNNLEKFSTGEVKETAKLKKGVTDSKEGGATGTTGATSFPLSPIMASSLGLNKIKTRSGPLPQESFFGYGSRDKGNALGVSNLSKTGGDKPLSSGWGKKKDEKKSGRIDNVSNSDGTLKERSPLIPGPSRFHSGESSSGAGQFNSSWSHSGGLGGMDAYTPELKTSYECENPKESESPRFQAIMRVTSAPRKRFPADIKSFSHELNSKGVRPYPFWKPRGLNNLEVI